MRVPIDRSATFQLADNAYSFILKPHWTQ